MKKIFISIVKNLSAIAFWIFIWFLIVKIWNIDTLILPSPSDVFATLWRLIKTEDFWLTSTASFCRVIIGIGLSLMIGCLLATLMSISKTVNTLFSPIISIIKATPVASFIIIAWLWLNTSVLPIFISSLIVIPIVTSNVYEGIASVDKGLLEVASVYGFSPAKKLFKLYIPSVMPYFLAACRASFGMAWKASVAAELIVVSESSIGYKLYFAKQDFESADVFAWTIVIIILSIILEKLAFLAFDSFGRRNKNAEA